MELSFLCGLLEAEKGVGIKWILQRYNPTTSSRQAFPWLPPPILSNYEFTVESIHGLSQRPPEPITIQQLEHLLETKHGSNFFRGVHSTCKLWQVLHEALRSFLRSFGVSAPPLSLWCWGRNSFIFSTLFIPSGSAKKLVDSLTFLF